MATASTSHAGILRPGAVPGHFELTRLAPAEDLAHLVERHWVVRWDLRGRAPHPQETLPHPCVNLVIEASGTAVHGCGTRRFAVLLADVGQVVGTKFRPGGFSPFVTGPVAALTDRSVPVAALFGAAGAALAEAVRHNGEPRAQVELVEGCLRARLAEGTGELDEVARVVEVVQVALAERELQTVAQLAARVGLPARALQRLFRRHVGVGPKWTLRRFRIHEAAERLAGGAPVDWAALAQELGYCDQAHFIRDFKAQVGRSPGVYAAECAG